MTSQDNQQGS